jgi:hypothetical protein
MRGVGVLASTCDHPAGDDPKKESADQATDQRNGCHTIHGQDLARAQRQNLVGSSGSGTISRQITTQ